MSVRSRGGLRLSTAAFALLALGAVSAQPSLAQDRTLVNLADVPAFVPAPYHPHSITATHSAALYDHTSYYGSVYQGGGAHYWH